MFRSTESLTGDQVFLINPKDLVPGEYIIGIYNVVRPLPVRAAPPTCVLCTPGWCGSRTLLFEMR